MSEDTSHESTITSLLTEHGRKPFQPERSEFVIHTSTIPLATTLDMQYSRKKTKSSRFVSHFHGSLPGISRCCPKRSCMYLKADRTRTNEKVPSNCPCNTTVTVDGNALQPLCFLSYVKSLNRNLVDQIDEDNYSIDPAKVMFCQDSQGIFDNNYPGPTRDNTGVKGFGHISIYNYLEVMDNLYWYRKYKRSYNLDKCMRSVVSEKGFTFWKKSLRQTLHTLNGLLVKKFIVFGPEIVDYNRIAEQTARLFRDLFSEYSAANLGELAEGMNNQSVYSEMKDLFNYCKQFFYKSDVSVRTSWLNWNFRNRSLGAFWGTEFKRLLHYSTRQCVGESRPYINSLAWIFRCTTFAQTRNMGYLPPHAAEVKFRAFREIISRPVEPLTEENDRLIRMAVRQRLIDGGIAPGFLQEPRTEEDHQIAALILSKINLDLKGTASVSHGVSEGGKLEDARKAIRMIIENKWAVPLRDVVDGSIQTYLQAVDNEDDPDWNRLLFWFSLQMGINWACERRLMHKDYWYGFQFKDGTYHKLDILEAGIVHIMEPGKVRNLVKGHGELAWVLTPAAKILQATLARLPEHRAGLELSAHDWIHTRRISAESDESGFIYEHSTGKRKRNIVQVFKDWTESTDFIGKRVGLAHLGSLMAYIGFPEFYGKLVLLLIREPQKVSELIIHRLEFDDENGGERYSTERLRWQSVITEGFMMGMPVTKVILHLIHVSERQVAIEYLRRRDIKLGDGERRPRYAGERVQLPRTIHGRGSSVPLL